MRITKKLFLCGLISGMALAVVSCDKDNNDNNTQKGKGSFLLALSGESTDYLMLAESLNSGNLSIADNNKSLEKTGYTWIFNDNPSVAVGLIYQQGDPGICLGYRLAPDGTPEEIGQFDVSSRFTSYGFFGGYALTSVGGQTPAGNNTRSDYVTFNFIDVKDLSRTEKSIPTRNITGNGEQATFSGIVDMGNGEFLTGLVMSQPKDPGTGGGASTGVVTYPDSVWVAAFDVNLNLKRIYRDNRLSYSSGRFRSQYYAQIAKAGDGNVYVFSGSFESATTKPCGALRINKGATAFDPGYYFNIEALTDGYRFRKVWHITGNCFLLEFYNDKTVSATGAASQYGVVDVSAKTFAWVRSGIPAKAQITATGLPLACDGKMYFPVTAEGADPAIYIIDPVTATAMKGLSVSGAKSITAVGRLHN
jgi:hypothetical protein